MRAVALWAEFPALADPRPIVLLHEAVRAEAGFMTGNAKMAFLLGVIEAAGDLPGSRFASCASPRSERAPFALPS